jgi:hypothetical protein
METRAIVTTLPVEEIIFSNPAIMLPFDSDKRLTIIKYIRDENKYLMSDGKKYNRNQFIPLAQFAIINDITGMTKILGRLQYKVQNKYKDGDIIYGKPNVIPNKLRLNDLVMVQDSAHVKGWDMKYNWGIVTNIRVTAQPGAVEITLPDGDEVVVSKRELLIIGRSPTCSIFNITSNNENNTD